METDAEKPRGEAGIQILEKGLVDAPTRRVVRSEDSLPQMALLDNVRPMEIGDQLLYVVTEEDEGETELTVNRDLKVRVPLLGYRSVRGETCHSLAHKLKAELEVDFFHRATVLIKHKYERTSRGEVTVLGEVVRPGKQEIPSDRLFRLSDAIFNANSFTVRADRETVVLKRASANGSGYEIEQMFDFKDIMARGTMDETPVLEDGDVIIVGNNIKHLGGYYVLRGDGVNAPGLYELPVDQELTLTRAILKGGGLTKFAKDNKVKVIRADKTLPKDQQVLYIDYDRIMKTNDRDSDVRIRPDDTIEVGEKWISVN